MLNRPLLTVCVAFILLAMSAYQSHGQIVYSGIRNIVIQNPGPDDYISRSIDLADNSSQSWDNLNFGLFRTSTATFGGHTSWSGEPCALAYETSFPYIERYAYGVTPTSRFGSGTMFLWNYHHSTPATDKGFFRNTSGYAYLLLGDFDGPKYYGWVHLNVSDYNLTSGNGPTITLIDWAFDQTPGNKLFMGEIPEPASLSLTALGGLAFLRSKWGRSGRFGAGPVPLRGLRNRGETTKTETA